MAGSTAGWWPSDRDRFPPRFLLPPSLQTHNCIISTHLASSPSRHPWAPSPPLSQPFSLSLFLGSFLFLVRQPSASPPSWSDLVRACSSLISRSFVRPTDRPAASLSPSLSLFLPSSSSSTTSPLLFRTKALPHARNGPPPLHSCAAPLARASFCHSRSAPRGPSLLHCPLFPSFSPREAEVMPRIRFFILPPPLPPSPRRPPTAPTLLQHHRHRRRSSPRPPLLLLCISRSSFSDRTGNTSRWTHNYLSHATTWAVREWEGRDPKMNGRAGGRTPSRTKRSRRCIRTYVSRWLSKRGSLNSGWVSSDTSSQGLERKSSSM